MFTALSAGKYLICEKELKKKYLFMNAFCFFGIMTTYTRIGWLGCAGFLCFLALLGIIAKILKINRGELNKMGILILTILYIAIFAGSMVAFPQLTHNIEESVKEEDIILFNSYIEELIVKMNEDIISYDEQNIF